MGATGGVLRTSDHGRLEDVAAVVAVAVKSDRSHSANRRAGRAEFQVGLILFRRTRTGVGLPVAPGQRRVLAYVRNASYERQILVLVARPIEDRVVEGRRSRGATGNNVTGVGDAIRFGVLDQLTRQSRKIGGRVAIDRISRCDRNAIAVGRESRWLVEHFEIDVEGGLAGVDAAGCRCAERRRNRVPVLSGIGNSSRLIRKQRRSEGGWRQHDNLRVPPELCDKIGAVETRQTRRRDEVGAFDATIECVARETARISRGDRRQLSCGRGASDFPDFGTEIGVVGPDNQQVIAECTELVESKISVRIGPVESRDISE